MFQFNRATISSFYIASWFSYLLFTSLLKEQIPQMANIFYSFLTRDVRLQYNSNSLFWYSIFFACLLVTFLLAFFVTRPLGIYMNNSASSPKWVDTAFFILTCGFFIYIINKSLGQAMPAEIPIQIVRLLGGVESAPGNNVSSVWSTISDTFWIIAPLGVVFFTSRVKSPKQEEGKE